MDQETLKTTLNGLERKVVVLLNEHKSLKGDITSLKDQNQELKTQLKARESQLADFKNQLKITKIVDQIHPENENVPELKRKVDEYIREIDKCIAYLSTSS